LKQADIATALAGLTEAERRELLALLQAAEQEAAEAPDDDRASIGSYLEALRQEAATRAADPEAWLAADETHQAGVERHLKPLLTSVAADGISAWFAAWADARQEAVTLATADGCPPPEAAQPAAADVVEADDDAPDAPALPRATADDVAITRARTAVADRAARQRHAPDQALRDAEVRGSWERAFPTSLTPTCHEDGI